jgi:hypothetical protein
MAVLLGLFFAPAALAKSDKAQKTPDQTPNDHPSGKDRSAEPGKSGTQGKSASDPDGDANGGADKPGMAGGFDADKDGNNGCGNDDDFEDDNNGWCGGKPKAPEVPEVTTEVEGETATRATPTNVLGVNFERVAPPAVSPAVVTAAPTGTLAATGRNLGVVAALGLMLVSMGTVMVAMDRRRLAPVRVRVDR